MTIAPLCRVVIVGAASARSATLSALQDAGAMHIDGLARAVRKAARAGEEGGERAVQALRYLARTPRMRAQISQDIQFDVELFVNEVLSNRDRRRAAIEQREELSKRIQDVASWGDFAFPASPKELGGARLWFYVVPAHEVARFRRLQRPYRVAHQSGSRAYVVVLSPDEPPDHMAPTPRIHIGSKSLAQLRAEQERLDLTLDELDHEREALTRRFTLLARDRAVAEDKSLLALATEIVDSREDVFVLRGWAPLDRRDSIAAAAACAGAAAVFSTPEPKEEPPTLLRPPHIAEAGGDLVRLYQVPSAREWDPSAVLFLSFSVFFALIVSDAAYGAVLLLAALVCWPLLGREPLHRRLRALWVFASLLAIAWGVAVGSYFGAEPPTPALASLKLWAMQDYEAMMALCIGVGAAHIALAILGAAWASRGRRAFWSSVGWLIALGAGVLAWRIGFAPPVFIGLGLAAILIVMGADSPLAGVYQLTNVAKLFADVLSYLRLFALGLASASLAVAFNDLASDMLVRSGSFGMLAAIGILIVGHGLNLVLSVMGGVVHGLRLNFIEFFSWGLKREGHAFIPFARKAASGA